MYWACSSQQPCIGHSLLSWCSLQCGHHEWCRMQVDEAAWRCPGDPSSSPPHHVSTLSTYLLNTAYHRTPVSYHFNIWTGRRVQPTVHGCVHHWSVIKLPAGLPNMYSFSSCHKNFSAILLNVFIVSQQAWVCTCTLYTVYLYTMYMYSGFKEVLI